MRYSPSTGHEPLWGCAAVFSDVDEPGAGRRDSAAGTSDIHLIHDGTLDLQPLAELTPERRLIGLEWSERSAPPAAARVLLYLPAEKIREIVPLLLENQWEVGVLPHPEAKLVNRALGLKGKVEHVFTHYLQAEAVEADILTCNGEAVLSSVVIGQVLTLGPYDAVHPPTRRSLLVGAFKALTALRLHSYKLTTGRDQQIQLAALGMVVLEQTQSTLTGRIFSEALSVADGRLTLLAFAPRSVISYIGFLLRLMLPRKISLSRLPRCLGLISSNRLLLEAPRGVDYSLDGTLASARTIDFIVLDQRMRLLPGPALVPREYQHQDKERIKMSHLPIGETAQALVEKPLPLISRAGEEEHRDLFVALRADAALSAPYLVLMVLSVLLALTGLYANSAPVIIGAMILAPLMSPIISLAMGLARTEPALIRTSLRTLATGVGLGLSCAIAGAWLVPLENPTAEMQARLHPTLLDLSVAVISGMAGAYASAKVAVAKSLAGVAIAVALVPPLSVAGIGIGWADWAMARGAALLFITNLVGIALAASVTFLVLGFAPLKLARKGLAVMLVMMAAIVGPLYISFDDLVERGEIVQEIPTGHIELANTPVRLRLVDVRTGDPPLARVILASSQPLDASHVDALKELVSERLGREILVEAELNLRR
ncbi:MAG: DUF389 domain-containing protein [Gammaproteobacteria bacterium]|nr:DUF389 domain-containing protein [Gammaproteobacteria bacterium]